MRFSSALTKYFILDKPILSVHPHQKNQTTEIILQSMKFPRNKMFNVYFYSYLVVNQRWVIEELLVIMQ